MLRQLAKSRTFRYAAACTGISMLAQLWAPTVSYALTSGPAQPESAKFTPVEATNMVDLFSGDFSYNLHLLTVPGAGAGYPINLSYAAAPGLEQEASWVGLGWNLNPGAVNRQMRGLPDDFNGDVVTRQLTNNANWSVSLGYNASVAGKEVFGSDFDRLSLGKSKTITYNNQTGVSVAQGLNFGFEFGRFVGDDKGFFANLGLSLDEQSGLGISPGVSYRTNLSGKVGLDASTGFTFSSKQGFEKIYFKASLDKLTKTEEINHFRDSEAKDGDNTDIGPTYTRKYTGAGAGMTFAASAAPPLIDFPRTGIFGQFEINSGTVASGVTVDTDYSAGFSSSFLATNELSRPAYGYFYQHSQSPNGLFDFHREKDVAITKSVKALPLPVSDNDIFNIQGQGVGTVVRAFRSDIGLLADPTVSSKTYGGGSGLDSDGGDSYKFGGNASRSVSTGRSGAWTKAESRLQNFDFQNTDGNGYSINSSEGFFEPFQLSSPGEVVAQEYPSNILYNNNPFQFEIADKSDPKVRNMIMDTDSKESLEDTKNSTPKKRLKAVEYLTQKQADDDPISGLPGTNYDAITYGDKSYPVSHHLGCISTVNPDGRRYVYGQPVYNLYQKDASFSVEHNYDATANPNYQGPFATMTEYNSADNSLSNNKGQNHVYSATVLPPYAHSFLLTSVLSSDYVDVNDDGPSEEDFGSWTEFRYEKRFSASNPYFWRAPYTVDDANGNNTVKTTNLSKGFLSNDDDDIASYSFGAKEIFYLKEVETKTHIAIFEMSDREDGLGLLDDATTNHGNGPANPAAKLRKLDKIKLFRKSPNGALEFIKTVNFAYSYDLCGNVPNNSGTSVFIDDDNDPKTPEVNINENKGKLTLKKVWFTYRDLDSAGELSPYAFDYQERTGANINHLKNPNYKVTQVDRWGNYQEDDPANYPYISNNENPYTNQQHDYNRDGVFDYLHGSTTNPDETKRNAHASAWSLRAITLPSGGRINVEYEQDDYAYVEDKPAMMLAQIVNTGQTDGTISNGRITEDDTRIYFRLKKPIIDDGTGMDKLAEYFKNIDQMYFKTYQRLKKHPNQVPGTGSTKFPLTVNGFAYDYVDGYAEPDVDADNPLAYAGFGFDQSTGVVYEGQMCYTTAWFDLKEVPISDKSSIPAGTTHPFRKAGWQYLRLQRPDLFNQPNGFDDITSIADVIVPVKSSITVFTELYRMLRGYYRFARESGYSKEIGMPDMGTHKPSYIRLNVPDKQKFGGGHRVAKITISDNWQAMSGEDDFLYGTEYDYTLPDGTSSGVARYEPLIGGEEIPHRLPNRYTEDTFLFTRDNNLYLEDPMGESYYPSAGVGYSRVTVRSLSHNLVTKATSGFTVHEYYTAKDFPVIVDRTELKQLKYHLPIFVPFVGENTRTRLANSMGYSIELNNMHGQMKSQATYSTGANPESSQPQAKTEYFFSENPAGNGKGARKLDNKVQVVVADGHTEEMDMGRYVENFIDTREVQAKSNTKAIKPNLTNSQSILAFILFATPFFDDSDNIYRSIVNVKVIRRNGIQLRTLQTVNGAITETQNLAFDGETGKPLLSSVTNSFKDPIYNYSFPAYYEYAQMGGADENLRAHIIPDGTSSIPAGATVMLRPGDLLMDEQGNRFWVESVDVDAGTAVIKDENNTTVSAFTDELTVIRSGNRNQTDASAYSLVSLEDPLNARKFPLFALWNNLSLSGINQFASPQQITHCHNQQTESVEFQAPTTKPNEIWVNDQEPPESCHAKIVFPNNLPTNIEDYAFKKAGSKVYAFGPLGEELIGEWEDPNYCFKECLDGVLNTQLARLDHEWDYNYDDALVEFPITTPTGQQFNQADFYANPFRFGRSGVYRPQKNYLYYTQRVQQGSGDPIAVAPGTNTNIREDGVFNSFFFYNWNTHDDNNYPWNDRSEITQYSPYGWELENKDALGIPSAALYGYDNLLPVAVGANNHYSEMAYDGFEDYNGPYTNGHGHLDFQYSTGQYPTINPSSGPIIAHTGNHSLLINAGNAASYSVTLGAQGNFRFEPKPTTDNDFYISAWVKSNAAATLRVSDNSSGAMLQQIAVSSDPQANSVEGWHRLEGFFKAPGNGDELKIELEASGADAYFDDIRVQRMRSQMTTYVYDPATLWLLAELDANNYATFYNYDEDGALVQVKKETARGTIETISTNRSNTVRVTP